MALFGAASRGFLCTGTGAKNLISRIHVPPSKGRPFWVRSQGAELVQNRAPPVRIVDIEGPYPATFGCREFSACRMVDTVALCRRSDGSLGQHRSIAMEAAQGQHGNVILLAELLRRQRN